MEELHETATALTDRYTALAAEAESRGDAEVAVRYRDRALQISESETLADPGYGWEQDSYRRRFASELERLPER